MSKFRAGLERVYDVYSITMYMDPSGARGFPFNRYSATGRRRPAPRGTWRREGAGEGARRRVRTSVVPSIDVAGTSWRGPGRDLLVSWIQWQPGQFEHRSAQVSLGGIKIHDSDHSILPGYCAGDSPQSPL